MDIDELINSETLVVNTSLISKLIELKASVTDVADAAQTAIYTLNDLLNYEQIDTGLFRIDLQVCQVTQDFLKLALNNLLLLSQKKNIHVNVFDQAHIYGRKAQKATVNQTQPSQRLEPSIESEISLYTTNENASSLYNENNDQEVQYLYCDKYLIEQVTRNLITNAIKFALENKSIDLYSKLLSIDELQSIDFDNKVLQEHQLIRKATLLIEITDSGAGIAIENQSKLFNEFVQFNPNELQGMISNINHQIIV